MFLVTRSISIFFIRVFAAEPDNSLPMLSYRDFL